VYPALAVHDVLTSKVKDVKTLWVGGEGGIEESLVKRHGIPFQSIPAAGVHGVSPLVLPRNLFMLARGVLASFGILNDFKPDVLFFTGGYVAAPMAFAGRSVPSLLYVPDIEPGMAINPLLDSDVIAVTTEQSQSTLTNECMRPDTLRLDLVYGTADGCRHLGAANFRSF
jgi:UDP-N-acetylglucosamine--N-acetylmuramyl-(pentapeptide) pyrophosphoryl-undecaprenol N-acetylglucosamine transferase